MNLNSFAELAHDRLAAAPGDVCYSQLTFRRVPGALDVLKEWGPVNAELEAGIISIATRLRELGLRKGDRVIIMCPSGVNYVRAFLACLYAGLVAVPVYPPEPAQLKRTMGRFNAIIADCDPAAVLATSALIGDEATRAAIGEFTAAPWVAADLEVTGPATAFELARLDGDDIAFLQYTSGSTGDPRGVMVTHTNLLAQTATIDRILFGGRPGVMVSWLPPFHDMGLIAGILAPLVSGSKCALMEPVTFLKRPLRWVQAISELGGTTTGAPNFAYDMVVDRSTPQERAQLDLSALTAAFCGAEPIRMATLQRFADAFAASGLVPSSLIAGYGLAEATLCVAATSPGDAPHELRRPGAAEHEAAVVSNGPIQDCEVRIVDPEQCVAVPQGEVGEIWVAGPTVARGYWHRPQRSAATFQAELAGEPGHWMRTGDLGFVLDGELYISGRLKDLIIVAGANHHPHDLEAVAVSAGDQLQGTGTAAFQTLDGDTGGVVLVCEVRQRPDDEPLEQLAGSIRRNIAEQFAVPIADIVFVRPGAVPKTTSGKIQRTKARDLYLTGQFTEIMRVPVGGRA